MQSTVVSFLNCRDQNPVALDCHAIYWLWANVSTVLRSEFSAIEITTRRDLLVAPV